MSIGNDDITPLLLVVLRRDACATIGGCTLDVFIDSTPFTRNGSYGDLGASAAVVARNYWHFHPSYTQRIVRKHIMIYV